MYTHIHFLSMIGFRRNQCQIWVIPIQKQLRTNVYFRKWRHVEDDDYWRPWIFIAWGLLVDLLWIAPSYIQQWSSRCGDFSDCKDYSLLVVVGECLRFVLFLDNLYGRLSDTTFLKDYVHWFLQMYISGGGEGNFT